MASAAVAVVLRGTKRGEGYLLERMKRQRTIVDVLLIDFVRQQDEVVLAAEAYNRLHVLEGKAVSRRVARVDHDQCPGYHTPHESSFEGLLKLLDHRG